ncbi:MAG: LCP family protein [Acutalibacteraceae bacterium]
MKDIYFNDMKGDKDNTDEIPILTQEEINMIKEKRRQKLNNLNSGDDYDSFYSRADGGSNQGSFYSRPSNQFNPNFEFDPDDFDTYEPRRHQNDEYNRHEKSMRRQTPPERKPPKPKKEKKKRGCGCGTAISALILAVVIAFTGCFGYVFSLMGKTQKGDEQSSVSSASLKSDPRVKNILLIGLDDDKGTGVSRSDSMMLLSVDTVNKKLKLTSFLRDLWVDIPSYKSAKLNASFAHGGAPLTISTIESNFKIDIDNYVLVNFDMFRQIIDSLGGITVDITEKEASFINRTTSSTVNSGLCELNGKKALIYARIRKLDSDFYRTQRQRKVITAIIDKAKGTNPVTLLQMVSDIMPLITTDFSQLELTVLAFSALKYIKYDIDQLQVPANDAYESKKISGQAALVPDIEKNTNNIISFIYE